MGNDWNNKTNSEILMDIKQLQLDHEALKLKLLKGYDQLIEIEDKYNEASKVMIGRLKGNNNG
jgi:hypothetical protein